MTPTLKKFLIIALLIFGAGALVAETAYQQELKAENEFYSTVIMGLVTLSAVLALIVFLQRRKVNRLKRELAGESVQPAASQAPHEPAPAPGPEPHRPVQGRVAPQKLPDPGLVFKFVMGSEVKEKLITVGQTEGTIKTYSTEVIDHHLSIYIRVLEDKDRDIYDMPDTIVEEYLVDIRRDGKTQIYYPGLEGFQEMPARQRIYVRPPKEDDDSLADELVFPSLEAKKPVRFRLGDRLNMDEKFVNGFFELHLITKDHHVQTKAGVPKIDKVFFIRLYKIYPGYDTGNPTSDGLYPMIDPFLTK